MGNFLKESLGKKSRNLKRHERISERTTRAVSGRILGIYYELPSAVVSLGFHGRFSNGMLGKFSGRIVNLKIWNPSWNMWKNLFWRNMWKNLWNIFLFEDFINNIKKYKKNQITVFLKQSLMNTPILNSEDFFLMNPWKNSWGNFCMNVLKISLKIFTRISGEVHGEIS